MTRVRDVLAEAASRLAQVSDTPRLDAELLMAHALGVAREELLLGDTAQPAPAAFDALIERRLAHEPIAYITGRRAFWTIELEVGRGALIPRPDSETLLEAAIEIFGEAGPSTILDLGTGPGSLLLAALDQWPGASGVGVDRSERALEHARRNARRLGLDRRAEFRRGDWGERVEGRFDLVLCNPPYVESDARLEPDVAEWEPAEALFAGEQGLEAFREIARQLPHLVAPPGAACIEIGAGQEQAVGTLFGETGFAVASRRDLQGIARCLILRFPGA